mgnify:CR=1 FL=1
MLKIKVNKLKINPKNPRLIRDFKFKLLVASVKKFPKMLEIREIVCDEDYIIIGGNQRFKACKEAGYKEVDVTMVKGWTKEEKDKFVFLDNIHYGQWDYSMLANQYSPDELKQIGLDIWNPEEDYKWEHKATDVNSEESDSENNTNVPIDDIEALKTAKKVIQLEFALPDYDEAFGLATLLRNKKVGLDALLINTMKKLV